MTQKSAAVDVPALVDAAKRHQGEALDQLLGLYRNYLRLLARAWAGGAMRGRLDPSDVVQNTLLHAAQAFDRFRGTGEEELLVWLRQILANQLTDMVRRLKAQRRDVRREEPLDAQLIEKLHDMASSCFGGPSKAVRRRELGVQLADALAQLSPSRREVIILRNLQELDWPQIAERLGKSEAAVRKLWARALLALRPLIDESL